MAVRREQVAVMSLRDNKIAVLRQLGEESEPISMPDLLKKLGGHFKERSVRRWLHLLFEEGVIQKISKKRGTKYIATSGSGVRHIAKQSEIKEVSSCFSTQSLEAIGQISRPMFEREHVTYRPEWLQSYIPNQTTYLSTALKDQLQKAGLRASDKDPAGTYAHQVFNRLIIDLSYNSSRLEGNTYSLLETERLLLHGEKAEGKLDEESVMILNHKEAIRYLVDNASNLKINRNEICTIHFLLADGLVEPKYAGKVRDYPVRIGGSVYIPFEDQRRLSMQLEAIAEKAILIQDPFEQSFFSLIHLSYLQAFADVNKRTARLVANVPLIKENLVPLAFRDVEVKAYMSAIIAIYELQDLRPLVDLYVYSYLRTCAAYDSTVKAMGFDEVRVRYRQQRRAIVREVILQCLVGKEMQRFIARQAGQVISDPDRQPFIDDVFEDLVHMDESRLAGFGVTRGELEDWQKLKQRN